MGHKFLDYKSVRGLMQPGDVIAFSGKGELSSIIKWATRSPVSHVGVIMQSEMIIGEAAQDGYFNQIIESTSLNGFTGVTISRLSDRIFDYEGDIWWLPLSKKVRGKLNPKKFYDFLLHQDRKPYDSIQAVRSALDALDKIPVLSKGTRNTEDFSRFFCSELVAAALEFGGALTQVNASEITPADLCMFNIYGEDYTQIKAESGPKQIKGYNSLNPTGWGQ